MSFVSVNKNTMGMMPFNLVAFHERGWKIHGDYNRGAYFVFLFKMVFFLHKVLERDGNVEKGKDDDARKVIKNFLEACFEICMQTRELASLSHSQRGIY